MGGAALVDLLEAERNDNAIRVSAVQSRADTAIAASALQAALGRLGASDAR
jgi:outer membrane protein TolC